jgi:hypothetical protein
MTTCGEVYLNLGVHMSCVLRFFLRFHGSVNFFVHFVLKTEEDCMQNT